MKTFSDYWFAEGTIDFEYKQYLLLAYLKRVRRKFLVLKLYPMLAQLLRQVHTLQQYQAQKQAFSESMPGKLVGMDPERMALQYDKSYLSSEVLEEIDAIVAYALPRLKAQLDEGTELYDHIEAMSQLAPVGVQPLYKDEGYLLLRPGTGPEVWVYHYTLSAFYSGQERMRSLKTQPITHFTYSLANTYQHMKLDLLRQNAQLPNPATYVFESVLEAPLDATLLPIAKRALMRYLLHATGA